MRGRRRDQPGGGGRSTVWGRGSGGLVEVQATGVGAGVRDSGGGVGGAGAPGSGVGVGVGVGGTDVVGPPPPPEHAASAAASVAATMTAVVLNRTGLFGRRLDMLFVPFASLHYRPCRMTPQAVVGAGGQRPGSGPVFRECRRPQRRAAGLDTASAARLARFGPVSPGFRRGYGLTGLIPRRPPRPRISQRPPTSPPPRRRHCPIVDRGSPPATAPPAGPGPSKTAARRPTSAALEPPPLSRMARRAPEPPRQRA